MGISNRSLIILACAHAAHETNRAYCAANGDTSQPPWHEAPDWQRTSAIKGVSGVLVDGNNPRQSHEGWLKEKVDTGWVYGAAKDPEKKTHPCMMSYDDLPAEQKWKDHLFVTTVAAMAESLGFKDSV